MSPAISIQPMGGPDIDQNLGLTSKRRSLYLRIAAEKEVEFLKIFDGPSVTECYQRQPSVVPQQALALANSELALRKQRSLADELRRPMRMMTYLSGRLSTILARTLNRGGSPVPRFLSSAQAQACSDMSELR